MFTDEKEIISGRSGIAYNRSGYSNSAHYYAQKTSEGRRQMHHEEGVTLQQGF